MDVAQASVISGTDSDPRFEQYYTDVPGKTPRVILYDDAEVRDMAEFHSWIEANFNIVDRYTVTHGSASLQVLLVGCAFRCRHPAAAPLYNGIHRQDYLFCDQKR